MTRVPLPAILQDTGQGIADLTETRRQLIDATQNLWDFARVLSGGLLAVASYEAKLAMGYHLHMATQVLQQLEHRLTELNASQRLRENIKKAGEHYNAAISSGNEVLIISAAYEGALADACRLLEQIERAPGRIADAPTRRIVALHLQELTDAQKWGTDALEIMKSDGDPVRAENEASASPHISSRVVDARRDDRFDVFQNTREYQSVGSLSLIDDDYERKRAELALVNRDEIDAIETFALVYFDLFEDVPLEMLADLARTCWDEVRHSLLGHQILERVAGNAFTFPCSTIGIAVRSRLGGWDALAQISLFGELNIISPMRSLAYTARSKGDVQTARAFDYICSDESLHLKRMRRWMRELHPLQTFDDIERHTQSVAGKVLHDLGVVDEDYFISLSSAEVFGLLGE